MSAQVAEDEEYQLRYEVVAGLDLAKDSAVACVRTPPAEGKTRRRSQLHSVPATVPAITELAELLLSQGVQMVSMEATSDYVARVVRGARGGRAGACAAANTGTFLGERFRRIASRPGGGGRKKAGCAVARSILVIVWHLLNDPAARYRDLGSDWHSRHTDRNRKARNAQRRLEALGYDVVITLREDAA